MRLALVTVVVAVAAFTLTAASLWLYATRPQEVRVEAYAVVNPTTLLAEVVVGVDEEFISAYAEESATVIVLHVKTRRLPGAYPAVGLMASEEIELQNPVGDRRVRAFDGARVREVSRGCISKDSIDEVMSLWGVDHMTPVPSWVTLPAGVSCRWMFLERRTICQPSWDPGSHSAPRKPTRSRA